LSRRWRLHPARKFLFRLPRLVAAFIVRRLRRGVLRIVTAEIGAIRTVAAATAAMPATTPMHSEAVLATVALIIAIPGILLRLPAAARDECRQAAKILPAFLAALAGLLVRL
jgi:hypothetical protein